MSNFIYSVWFRDAEALPDDQDREWVACMIIEAATAEAAKEWGDTLARDRAERIPRDCFVSSSVEPESDLTNADMSLVPRIRSGQWPSDELLGW